MISSLLSQYVLLLLLFLLLSSRVHAFQLLRVRNAEVFSRRAIGEELILELSLTEREMQYFAQPQLEVQMCVLVNGALCRCFHRPLQEIGVRLTEDCLPSPHWSFFFLSLALTGPNNANLVSSNPLLLHRPLSSVNTHTHSQTYTHTSSHSQTHSHTHTHTLTNAGAQANTHTQVQTLTESQTAVSRRVRASGFMPDQLTLLLLLTLDDLSRATVLLESLIDHFSSEKEDNKDQVELIFELLVLVPDTHYTPIQRALQGFAQALSFPVRIVRESVLFFGPLAQWKADPYAVQMALKLLAARIVRTPFYLTLDADLVLLREMTRAHLLSELVLEDRTPVNTNTNTNENGMNTNTGEDSVGYSQLALQQRAVYHKEGYETHGFWWDGVKTLLGVDVDPTTLAFGVTPAVLNTWGSLLAVSLLRAAIGIDLPLREQTLPSVEELPAQCGERGDFGDGERLCQRLGLDLFDSEAVERVWLKSLGKYVWTEYTLYRTTLEVFKVFDDFHVSEEEHGAVLHCHDVWYKAELPWDAQSALQNTSCLFSVVQSTSGVSPAKVLRSYREARDKV